MLTPVVTLSFLCGRKGNDPVQETARLHNLGRRPAASSNRGDLSMARMKGGNASAKAAVPAVLRPSAAGVDIGAREIFVAVPADRDPQPVRSYATFTEDLHHLADWLQQCGIQTSAAGKFCRCGPERSPAVHRWHFEWRRTRCLEADPGWVDTIAACAPDWEPPKPSRRKPRVGVAADGENASKQRQTDSAAMRRKRQRLSLRWQPFHLVRGRRA